jgi:RNA polymerase-binding transcription factor DksA
MKTKHHSPSGAKTRDVLGQDPDKENMPAAWQRHYARLLQLQKHLLRDTEELEGDAKAETSSFSMHMADAATDSFDRDLALSLLAMDRNAVQEINAAIQRIREGRYGVCELTGNSIPSKRLEAIPWARYTVAGQAELEKRGEAAQVHLNKLDAIVPERLEPE